MNLTPEQIDHIATLARLDISAEDKASFGKQLSSIIAYVDVLGRANTDDVQPMEHSVAVANVFRSDEVRECPADVRAAALAGFPERDGDLLKVKAVFS